MRSTSLSAVARSRCHRSVFGRDLFWWLVTTRLFKTSIDSRLGQKLSQRETLIGSSPQALEQQGVR